MLQNANIILPHFDIIFRYIREAGLYSALTKKIRTKLYDLVKNNSDTIKLIVPIKTKLIGTFLTDVNDCQ